jgi:hypothetical protein
MAMHNNKRITEPGLPDFSWHSISKREKYTSDHKINQMAVKYIEMAVK